MAHKIFSFLICVAMLVCLPTIVNAHPGRTDSKGGHHNRSTGEYHYHHGNSAHDHYDMDGDGVVDCPFNFVNREDSRSSEKTKEQQNTVESYAYQFNDYQGNDKESDQKSIVDRFAWILPAALYLGIPAFSIIRSFVSSLLEKRHTNVSNQEILKTLGIQSLKLPPKAVLLQGGLVSLGKPTPFAPYGEYTVYITSKGKTFHKSQRCSRGGAPSHIFEISKSLTPCRRCAKSIHYPVIIPSWYKEIKEQQDNK